MPVLNRSLEGMGAPRKVVPGEYSLTDLQRKPLVTIAKMHLGLAEPEGISPVHAARGFAFEHGFLRAVPIAHRRLKGRLSLGDAAITNHPDYIWNPDGPWEVGEGKSNTSNATEDQAIEQALGYVAVDREGTEYEIDPQPGDPAGLTVPDGAGDWTIEQLVIIQGDMHAWNERVYPVNDALVRAVWRDLEAKVSVLEECRAENVLGPAAEWDKDHAVEDLVTVPFAEGDAEQEITSALDWYVQWKASEHHVEALKPRIVATLAKFDPPKLKTEMGSVGLAKSPARTVFDEVAFHDAGGTKIGAEARALQARLDELVQAAAAKVRAENQTLMAALDEAMAKEAALREQFTRTEQGVHVRFYPRKDLKTWTGGDA